MTYTDADVRKLVESARDTLARMQDGVALWPNGHSVGILKRALDPFIPTPEQLRMERGFIAFREFESHMTLADTSDVWWEQAIREKWNTTSWAGKTTWCHVADAAIAEGDKQNAAKEDN